MTRDEIETRLREIYDAIPDMADCKGKCEDSCRSPFDVSRHEAERVRRVTGRELVPGDGCRGCSHLTPLGRCSVYADRPVICRAFGTSPAMRCEHGCKPTRWLTDGDVMLFVAEAENLSGDGDYDLAELRRWADEDPSATTRMLLAIRAVDHGIR